MFTYNSASERLFVAHDIEQVPEALDVLFAGEAPGFQAGPEVDTESLLITLTKIMQERVDPDFVFDATLHVNIMRERTPVAHVDIASQYKRGLAVHNNRQGYGRVALQLVYPGYNSPGGRWRDEDLRGRRFKGHIVPGTKTVFSEGIQPVDGSTCVGPTLHLYEDTATDFTLPAPDSGRSWTRWTYSGQTAQ